MLPFRRLHHRLRALFRREQLDREMDDEMRFHLEMDARERATDGAASGDARRAAAVAFGGIEQARQRVREARGWCWLENLLSSIRVAARRLRKSPGFAAVTILTLAFCVAQNVVIFAVVDAVLLRPLPFPDSDRLVVVRKSYPGIGIDEGSCSVPNYCDWGASIPAFASVSATCSDTVVIGEVSSPSRVTCERVTADFLTTLGSAPALGRFFTEEEIENPQCRSVVLSDAYWRNELAADPDVVGRELRIDGQAGTIIGVLPKDFRFLSSRAPLFLPLIVTPSHRQKQWRHNGDVRVFARLAAGASTETAQAQIRTLDAQQLLDDPYAPQLKAAGYSASVVPLHADHVREVRPTLLLLQGGALLLLAIGGVNLANLLLIRASSRTREIAVHQALGAGRGDVLRESGVETLLLSLIGGTVGLGLGALGIRLLTFLRAHELPLGAQIQFDGRVALATWAGSFLVGIALALPIAWYNTRDRIGTALRVETRGGTTSHGMHRVRQGFIVAQISLAFVLLTAAALLGTSLQRLLIASPGFQPDLAVSGAITLPQSRYPDRARRRAFTENLLRELRSQPGIASAGISTAAPFTPVTSVHLSVMSVEGVDTTSSDPLRAHDWTAIIGDYGPALGLPLVSGRWFDEADHEGKLRACLVDEAFARRYWPDVDPLGKRFAKNATFVEKEAFTVVGVVGTATLHNLADTDKRGTVYFPFGTMGEGSLNVVVRSPLAASAVGSILMTSVHRLDPELPVDDIRSMRDRIDVSLVPHRSSAVLGSLFAVTALVLAALGTYGVLGYAVAQRQREFGIRLAVGAQRRDILTLVLGGGLRMVFGGIVLGLAGSIAVGKSLDALLFGISAHDPATLACIAVLLVAVTGAACTLPALRATRVAPMEALRTD